MHYFIIIIIITIIVIWQISIFGKTINKLQTFKSIFANDSENYKLQSIEQIEQIEKATDDQLGKKLKEAGFGVQNYYTTKYSVDLGDVSHFNRTAAQKDLTAYYQKKAKISSDYEYRNPIFKEIITSINNYLSVNKSNASDFHLMKDIVDRNCDAQEEEINTQIPVPLYLGLVGTMGGILVGIGYLWLSGGIKSLLSVGNSSLNAEGIEALLGGVALAMIASICGILFTTWGSLSAKNAKAKVEKNKHIFLSWIQANLLPALSDSITDTLERLGKNLATFNKTFSGNTTELSRTLSQVNESYKLQTELLNVVNQIADKDVSYKNIQLYKALQKSVEEIETLAEYLSNINEYLANVKALNEKLDASEQRVKAIEDMGKFFKTEVNEVEARKAEMTRAVGKVDEALNLALSELTNNASKLFEELNKVTAKQHEFLEKNSTQINALVSELKNLTAVKTSINNMEKATSEQNKKLDKLAESIQALAKSKSGEQTTPASRLINKETVGIITTLVAVVLIVFGIFHYFTVSRPAKIDREADRYYTFADKTELFSSPKFDNRITLLDYGSELITYQDNNIWSVKDASGNKGYIYSYHLLKSKDFDVLDGIWGNAAAKECIDEPQYRLALLDYFKKNNLDSQWKVYCRSKDTQPNTVFFSRLYGKNSLAVIVKNTQTGKRKTVIFIFNANETITSEGTPDGNYINNVSMTDEGVINVEYTD